MLADSHPLTLSEIPDGPSPECPSLTLRLYLWLLCTEETYLWPKAKSGKKGESIRAPDPQSTQNQKVKAESGIQSGPALKLSCQATSKRWERLSGKHPSGQNPRIGRTSQDLETEVKSPKEESLLLHKFCFQRLSRAWSKKAALQPCIRDAVYSLFCQ